VSGHERRRLATASIRTSGRGHVTADTDTTRFRTRGRARQSGHRRPSPCRHRRQRLVVNLLLRCRHDRPDPVDTGRPRSGCVIRRTLTATSSAGTLLVAPTGNLHTAARTRWTQARQRVPVPSTVPAHLDKRRSGDARAPQPSRPAARPGVTRAPCTCGSSRNSRQTRVSRLLCSCARA